MTVRLPPRRVGPLVECLEGLTDMAASGLDLGDRQLRTLLLGVGLESDAGALRELQRWARLLAALRESPTEENRTATSYALKLRGLSASQAQMAVAKVAGPLAERVSKGRAPRSRHLTATEALPLLHLVGPPWAISVDPGGSGDLRSLAEAAEKAAEGGTLLLRAGVHRLSEPLKINKALNLMGEGMDRTRVVSTAAWGVVEYSGMGMFRASGICFVHEGDAWADCLSVYKGELELSRCRFEGAAEEQASHTVLVHAGLQLCGCRGSVRECVVADCRSNGIVISSCAQLTLEANTCLRNLHSGIACYSDGVTARNNVCRENEHHGIFVGHLAHPMLIDNKCEGNRLSGIGFPGTSGGEARGNVCRQNVEHGIHVGDRAEPDLGGNRCAENGQSGILYSGASAGVATYNKCEGNGMHGICVSGQACPDLKNNTCEANARQGMAFVDRGAGTASFNTCVRNEMHGILVMPTASPMLERNWCADNRQEDVHDQRAPLDRSVRQLRGRLTNLLDRLRRTSGKPS